MDDQEQILPPSAGSTRSWPRKQTARFQTSAQKKKRRLKQRIVFDHLWGIPGGLSKQDLAILRHLEKTNALDPRKEPTPYLILDKYDVAENRDRCCNHDYGRTVREWAWHTSLHGWKYVVFQRDHLCQRIFWAVICLLALGIGIVFSVLIVLYYFEDPLFLSVQKIGLQDHEVPLPPIAICPGSINKSVSKAKRAEIENQLPPMKAMWPIWEGITREYFDPDDRNGTLRAPWKDEKSSAVQDLLHQIMIEGGLMSMASCEETILECSIGTPEQCCRNSKVLLTQTGPCYSLEWSAREGVPEASTINLGHYLKRARADLNLSIVLSGTSSTRVGYPIVRAKYFGNGYLCPENWGDTEASVICRSLGFSGGERFFMDRVQTFAPMNLLGLGIKCQGDENSIMDCRSDYSQLTGQSIASCQSQTPVAVMCDQGAIQLGQNKHLRTRGLAYMHAKLDPIAPEPVTSYFCGDTFGDSEALVFCRMLSWKFGKRINLPSEESLSYTTHIHDLKCRDGSQEPHILDCSFSSSTGIQSSEEAAKNCSTGPAGVECSPGFPFTLRLFNGPLASKLPAEAELTIGYPVIDTTSRPGYICDRNLNEHVVPMLCQSLGFRYGRKLPAGLYGLPEEHPLFVLEKLTCSGVERSIFECQLGPWGDHKCNKGDILAVACANDETNFDFNPVIVDRVTLSVHAQSGFAAIQTSHGIIPVCHTLDPNGGRHWGDREANLICLDKEFECGMLNRTLDDDALLSAKGNEDAFLRGTFARFNCSDSPSAQGGGGADHGLTRLWDSCHPRLMTSCASGVPASALCLSRGHPDFELCKLLQNEAAMSRSSHLPLHWASELNLEMAFPSPTKTDERLNASCSPASSRLFVGGDVQAQDNEVVLRSQTGNRVKVSAKLIDTTARVMSEWTREADRWCRGQAQGPDTHYSPSDCREGCRATLTQAVCGCVPWYLSRTLMSLASGSRICSGTSILCLRNMGLALEMASQNITLAESLLRGRELDINGLGNVRERCNCPPACRRVIQYSVESTTLGGPPGTCGNEREHGNGSAWLHLRLDRRSSISYLRRGKLSWELTVALVGGIMAFCCGLGLISVVEWLYFHTIRWWNNARDPDLRGTHYQPLAVDLEPDQTRLRSQSDPELTSTLGPSSVHFVEQRNETSHKSTVSATTKSRSQTAASRKSVPPPTRNTSLISMRAGTGKRASSRVGTTTTTRSGNTSAARGNHHYRGDRSVRSTASKRTPAWVPNDHHGLPPLDGM